MSRFPEGRETRLQRRREALIDLSLSERTAGLQSNCEAKNGLVDGVKVCQIIPSFRPVIGGAERMTERLCGELVRRGMEVILLTRRRPGLTRSARVNGFRVERLGHPSRSKIGALTFALHVLWSLAVRLRDYNVIHVQSPDTPLLIGFLAKVLLRRRLVATIHSAPRLRLRIKPKRKGLRFYLTCRLVDSLAVLSREMETELVKAGMPSSRIRLVPNAVDTSVFRPEDPARRQAVRALLHLERDSLVFVYVGRLIPLKRVGLLLQAWAETGGAQRRTLLVIGDGPQSDSLRQLRLALRLHNVRLEGSQDDVLPFLHAADVFVLPSQREGQSVALLEAMAVGLPVIASDHPANRALIRHGQNGWLFEIDNLAGLKSSLAVMRSDALRHRLGKAAADTIRSHHSLSAMASVHRDLYREIVAAS